MKSPFDLTGAKAKIFGLPSIASNAEARRTKQPAVMMYGKAMQMVVPRG